MTDRIDDPVTDLRPAYDPPRALRLSDMGPGSGVAQSCDIPGSNADGDCQSGSLAGQICGASGSAADICVFNGSSADSTCSHDGSDVLP